jgi:hypothetical protein
MLCDAMCYDFRLTRFSMKALCLIATLICLIIQPGMCRAQTTGMMAQDKDSIPSSLAFDDPHFFVCAEAGPWWYPTWRHDPELFYDFSAGYVFTMWRHSSGDIALYSAPRLGIWWIPDAGGLNPIASSLLFEVLIGMRGWNTVSLFGGINLRGGSSAYPYYFGYGLQFDVWKLFLAFRLDVGLKAASQFAGSSHRDRSFSLMLGVKF